MKILKYHTQSKSLRACLARGFTLIEIMVATVIMVIMVGLVIQITSEVLNVWNRSSGKLTANAEARIAMDLLTQDLETAVYRNNGMQWLRAEDDGVVGPAGQQTATVALRLFSPAMDRPSGPGDICAIAYKLDYRDPITGNVGGGDPDDRLFILYRLVVGPEQTFNELMGAENDQHIALPDKDSDDWNGVDIVGDDGGNYLVSNIVSFKIDFHVEDDGNTATPTLVPDDTIYGGTDATVGSQSSLGDEFKKPLAYADITLTIISEEGAALLQNISKINEDVDSVIQQYGEVYTRRVNFLARPL